MGLGISGSHRSGKSSVATVIAQANNAPFLASSASQIAKDMGIQVQVGMPLDQRMEFQEEVLRRFVADYEATDGGLFITDRTPLDLAAYAILDWHPLMSNPELDKALADYVNRCIAVTTSWFFNVGILQPGIPYVIEPGKPAPNVLYQELLNTTIIGLAFDPRMQGSVRIVGRGTHDIQQRAKIITDGYASNVKVYSDFIAETMTTQ